MTVLQDPRRFLGTCERGPLIDLAAEVVAADALRRPGRLLALRQAIESGLMQGDEQALRSALKHAPDLVHHRVLRESLALAVDAPVSSLSGIVARAFALPVVLIAASAARIVIPGRLPDIARLQALFERHHALGPTRNFGLSNALCSLEALDGLSPLAVFRAVRSLDPQSIGAALVPADITVEPGREQAHLRFVVGAGISAFDAPGFTETAANIAPWGRECTQLLGAQLALPEVQLLALPRPPRDLMSAAHAGRLAQLEVALDLFASATVRRFRAAVGDPAVIVSTHEGGELRVTLSSPFAQDLLEGFRWPLHPLDDIAQIERHILDLFEDVRVRDVRLAPVILPSARDSGSLLHPRAEEWETLLSGRPRH